MNWLTDKERRIAFGVPPKNGYQSIRKVLNGQSGPVRIPLNRLKHFPRKVFVVRHPVERFMSLYRNKCRDGERGLHLDHIASPRALFEHIQTAPPDDHWARQVDLLAPFHGKAELVQLDRMADWWRDNMPGEFPHLHQTADREAPDPELFTDLALHYRADLDLFFEADNGR